MDPRLATKVGRKREACSANIVSEALPITPADSPQKRKSLTLRNKGQGLCPISASISKEGVLF
jgi:hypothetical protein